MVRAKPRLHMPDRRLVVIGGKRPCKGRRRVAVNEDDIRRLLRQNRIEPAKRLCRDVKERLPRLHDIEVIVGLYLKEGEHLIEHLAVLCCDGDDRLDHLVLL